MADGIIEVKLSLKGRPIREFAFAEPRVTIGRDPQSQIFLDNPGISRCHAALIREEDGLYVHDQESANGTFLNEEPVRRALVRDGDRIRIGKFLLLLKLDTERRSEAEGVQRPAFPESTMVLEPAQIERLMLQTRQAEKDAESRSGTPSTVPSGNVLRVRDVASRPTLESTPQRGIDPRPTHESTPQRGIEPHPKHESTAQRETAASPAYETTAQPSSGWAAPTTDPRANPPLRAVDSPGSTHETTFRTASRTGSSHSPSNAARSAAPLSLHVSSPDSATVSVRRDSRNDRPTHELYSAGSPAPGTGGFISWLRANAIGIEIGFSVGLAAGILIAKTLLG